MLDDAFLGDWCGRHLGARPARVLFRSGHLSQVIAAELADGSSGADLAETGMRAHSTLQATPWSAGEACGEFGYPVGPLLLAHPAGAF